MNDDIFRDKESEEFDERIFGGKGSNQPLTVTMRRIRSRERIVIDWKLEDWLKWENPVVIGRRYDNYIPTTMTELNESDNPSRPIIPATSQRIGTTGELEVKAGQEAYFGFWLKGEALPKPKFLRSHKWVDWSSHELIAFSVIMPVRLDSLEELKERREIERLKDQLFQTFRDRADALKVPEEKPKADPIMAEFEEAMAHAERLKDYLGLMDKAAEKQQAKINDTRGRCERGEMDPVTADFLIEKTKQVYTNIINMLALKMLGEPRA